MICKKCGKENNNGEKYCGNCGEALYEENKKSNSNNKLLVVLLVLILIVVLGLIIIKVINFNSNNEDNTSSSTEINNTEELDNQELKILNEKVYNMFSIQPSYYIEEDFNNKSYYINHLPLNEAIFNSNYDNIQKVDLLLLKMTWLF